MKSKTSFFNKTIYKKNLTRFMAFPLLYFAFLFISTSCNMIVHHLEIQKYPETYSKILQTHQDLYTPIAEADPAILVALYLILVTLAVFSYLYQRRTCNMMHTFPVNRKILFVSSIASILTLTFLPQLAVTLINTIIYLVFGAGNIIWIPWYWLLCMIAYDLCFLGIALFTAMISGQLITNFIFYWIFNFMFMAAEIVIRLVFSLLCFGMTTADVFESKLRFLTPSAYLADYTSIYMDETGSQFYHIMPQALPVLFTYALLGIGLVLIAHSLYQRKALETCGDFLTVGFMKPVFTLGMTFFASLLATVGIGYTLSNLLSENQTIFFITITIVCLAMGAILYFIIQMLIERSIHVWEKHHVKYCCIYTGIILVFLLCVHFDVCGIERQVPAASDVLELDLMTEDATYAFTDTDEITDFISVHKEIIENKSELSTYSRHCNEPYAYLGIAYHLKDGSTLNRSYRLPDYAGKSETYQNICEKFLTLFNEKNAILTHGISKNYATLQAEDVSFYSASNPDQTDERDYTDAQLQNLYQAFLQDVKDGNYQIVSLDSDAPCYADSIGLILRSPEPIILDRTIHAYYTENYALDLFSSHYASTNTSDVSITDESKDVLASYGDLSVDLYIRLTPDCTHTLQAMIDMGMITSTDDLTLSTAGEVYMFTDE